MEQIDNFKRDSGEENKPYAMYESPVMERRESFRNQDEIGEKPTTMFSLH